MDGLKKVFESLGFKNVKTLLASGNVVFETQRSSSRDLAKRIEETLKKKIGHEIGVHIRTITQLQHIEESNPFKAVNVTPQTRFYVTFLSDKPKGDMKIPYQPPDKSFKLLRATESEVYSVVTPSPHSGTRNLMGFLEKQFGRKITTRNWNTISRILQIYQ